MAINGPSIVFRKGREILVVPLTNKKELYWLEKEISAQRIFTISQDRNKFFIKGVKNNDSKVDVDDLYNDQGEP